jgi:hypothetical protein
MAGVLIEVPAADRSGSQDRRQSLTTTPRAGKYANCAYPIVLHRLVTYLLPFCTILPPPPSSRLFPTFKTYSTEGFVADSPVLVIEYLWCNGSANRGCRIGGTCQGLETIFPCCRRPHHLVHATTSCTVQPHKNCMIKTTKFIVLHLYNPQNGSY